MQFFQINSFSVRNSGELSNQNTLSDQPIMDDSDESENFRFGSVHGLTNVTVQVGTIAYMHCPVVNLGEREVSIVVVIIIVLSNFTGYR